MKTAGTLNNAANNAASVAEPNSPQTMAALCTVLERVLAAGATLPARLALRWGEASIEVAWPTASAAPTEPAAPVPDHGPGTVADHFVISAPLVGTFYRRPEPGAPAFVDVGDVVRPGEQVAIVEAMKLMNAIEASQAGRLVEVVGVDGATVEYGQPLFVFEPVEEGG